MSILDRFKAPPKWKSTDPTVRVAGVQEIPEEEQDLLSSIAREDEDPLVRRAAVSKLGIVAVLGERVRDDPDPGVREEASGVLLDIALGAYEAEEAASLAALDALGALPQLAAHKHYVLVAKTARREGVAIAALARLSADEKSLSSVARRAERESVRMAALAQVTSPAELTATALRSNFKDSALGALEQIAGDVAALKTVAARAVNAAAGRRARAMLRAAEEAEAARAVEDAARLHAIELHRRALGERVREITKLAADAASAGADARLEALVSQWNSEGGDADPALAERFSAAVGEAQEALARAAADREAAEQAAAAAEAAMGLRRMLVDKLESLDATAPEEAHAAIVAEWAGLDPLNHPAAGELASRFERAVKARADRQRELAGRGERLQRAGDLVTALEAVVADERYPGAREVRQRARRLRQDWTEVRSALGEDADAVAVLARGAEAESALDAREQAWRSTKAAESDEQRRRAQQSLQRLTDLTRVENPTLKSLEKAVSEALVAETALEQSPADPARDELMARLVVARAEVQPKLQALRDADDWQRWANAGVQERLIGEMEALANDADPGTAHRRSRELMAEWKTVASAPRDRAEALWRRFRAAGDLVRSRLEPLRAQQAAEQADHLARKIALCEKAEAISASTDWIATADALKALQAEWKQVGPAPRRDEQAVWERFRAACNAFFTRRQEDLKQRKEAWTGNLERKEALIARAEQLAEASDAEAAFAELKALQSEWKTIGPVKKSRSEQVWQRFRTASDRVFDRYRNRDSQAVNERVSRREGVLAEIEALAAKGDELKNEPALLDRVRSIRTGWHQAGALPRDTGRALSERFDRALGVITSVAPEAFRHTELDVQANRRQLESLCERVERLSKPEAPAASPVSVLANQLREALAANTIGGRADEESRWKSSEYEVRTAQDAWRQVGFVPEHMAAPLTARFQRACQKFYGQKKRK